MRFPAGEACTCENGPSFLAWKQVPPVTPPRVLVSDEMCTSKRTAVFGLFWSSMTAIHDCMCASAAAVRRVEESTRDTPSVRDMLHIESSRRFRRVCVNTCRAHMRIRALASAGRVHVKLDRRFRHVCPFLVCMWPRKCCTCQNSAVVFDMLPF